MSGSEDQVPPTVATMEEAAICLNGVVTRSGHACVTCGRELTDDRPLSLKLLTIPEYRHFFGHALGCEICGAAARQRNAQRLCTRGQLLLRECCEVSEHAA